MDPKVGFDIFVNGAPRTFRDQKPAAFEAAANLKRRWPQDEVVIIDRAADRKVFMREDGRTE